VGSMVLLATQATGGEDAAPKGIGEWSGGIGERIPPIPQASQAMAPPRLRSRQAASSAASLPGRIWNRTQAPVPS